MKKAVILLNMGGPTCKNEVGLFLKNMFNDVEILGIKNKFLRSFVAFCITKSREKQAISNYDKIGGYSPLNSITSSLCDKVNTVCGDDFVCDYAMNYVPPFADEVLKKYENFDEIVLLPLYPHYSKTTVKSSLDDAKMALKNFKGKVKILPVFYDDSVYNDIVVNLIKSKINHLDKSEISEISLIFSAHSLPQSIIDKGDLYESHVKSHVEILKEKLKNNGINFKEIILAYQSRLGPVKWLEPNISEILTGLKSKKALIFPIAFCIDNSETNFELSIYYKNIAKELNFSYFDVCSCPNDSLEFANFIANISKK